MKFTIHSLYNSVFCFFFIQSDLCNHPHHLILEHFHHPPPKKKQNPKTCPSAVTPYSLPLLNPWQLLIYFPSLWICLLFQINGIMHLVASLCPTLFIQYNVFKIHLYCSLCQYFIPFLWLNNTPWYGYTSFYLFTC